MSRLTYESPTWRRISHFVRIQRAQGRCEHCGVAHGAIAADGASLIELQCAHLNGIPQDCRPENLRALCTQCHHIYDQLRRVQTLLARYPHLGAALHFARPRRRRHARRTRR
jgi:hypothetical protein